MTQAPHALQFQDLYDTAQKLLELSLTDEQSARDAIGNLNLAVTALDRTREILEHKLGRISGSVVQTIEASAETTADKVANLLQKKFQDANTAATEAASRYNDAAKMLTWKLAAVALGAQVALFGGAWLLVQRTIPSVAEIESRKQTIAQQAAMLATLEERGGMLDVATCVDKKGREHQCFRTDESIVSDPFRRSGEDKTYRVLWGR